MFLFFFRRDWFLFVGFVFECSLRDNPKVCAAAAGRPAGRPVGGIRDRLPKFRNVLVIWCDASAGNLCVDRTERSIAGLWPPQARIPGKETTGLEERAAKRKGRHALKKLRKKCGKRPIHEACSGKKHLRRSI